MTTWITTSRDALAALEANAAAADADPVWPAASWDALRRAGVLTWSLPKEYGGQEYSTVQLLEGYGELSSACLTTAFILSQREAAARRLIDHGNETIRKELLPALARGEQFTTVGLSQLTTSRQHGKPAMIVRMDGDKLIFDGVMPWVTGAPHADYFITGGALDDGRQILAVMHRDLPRVRVGPPLDLMALQGSLTAEVACDQVAVEKRWLLAGPVERVLTTGGRGGTGGLETSCLALGLTSAAVRFLEKEAAARPELETIAGRLRDTLDASQNELLQLARGGSTAEAAVALRGRANTLVLQATQAAVTAAKGAGFLRQHPTQRWARQALFFLVWSCPRPAAEATLAYLTPHSDNVQVCH